MANSIFGAPPAGQQAQPRRPSIFEPKKPAPPAELSVMTTNLKDLSKKTRLVEERIDNLGDHLEVIDRSLIDKHKLSISEINNIKSSIRKIRSEMNEVKNLTERVIRRSEDLASKEEVKIIQRYIDLWQPMKYVTRSEVESIVKSILNTKGIKKKK